jgi:ribonuclease VapC
VTVVLDASALLAVFNDEPGADRVIEVLDDSVINTVNLAEVAAALIAKGKSESQARAAIRAAGCAVVEADHELGLDAGFLRKLTKPLGLSLGDRFCLAQGRRMSAPVMTADREWVKIADVCEVSVQLIR